MVSGSKHFSCKRRHMRKKLFSLSIALAFAALGFVSCGSGGSNSVAVSYVDLDKGSLRLRVGATETLVATVEPSNATNKNVTWSTSNPSVASVSNGAVTGTGAGTATITATTQDGGKTDTCAVTVNVGITDWAVVSAGDYHTMALKRDGSLWATGGINRDYGSALGTGGARGTFGQVGTDTDWVDVSAGGAHTMGIKRDGSLWAWGSNTGGLLGIGGGASEQSTPVKLEDTDLTVGWARVSAGYSHTMALGNDGSLWAWGSNLFGGLGLGDTTRRSFPTRVGDDTDWAVVSAGGSYTVALKRDGSLWAWGYNGRCELGLGDTTNRNDPTRVGTNTDWAVVSAGYDHTMAIKADGSLWAWGYNGSGRLGLGDTTNRNVPTRVGAATDWTAVSAGGSYTVAVKRDGSLWGWGNDEYCQLGLGRSTPNQQTSPVRVGTANDWAAVSASGSYHTVGLKTDGSLWGWGSGFTGGFGMGDQEYRYVPTEVMDNPNKVPVSSVIFDPTAMTYTVQQLNSMSNPILHFRVGPDNATDKSLSWSSSNYDVCSLGINSSGGWAEVRPPYWGWQAGQSTITARATDGSGRYATCRFTVTGSGGGGGDDGPGDPGGPGTVRSVSVSPSTLTLNAGQSYQLSATISPSNATNPSLTWSSGVASVAAVSQTGRVTALYTNHKTSYVHIRAEASTGSYGSCYLTVINPNASASTPPDEIGQEDDSGVDEPPQASKPKLEEAPPDKKK